MEITIRDKDLNKIDVIDVMDSLIWTDRYDRHGDFEIANRATAKLLGVLQEDYYVTIPESEHMMVIETVELNTNAEDGNQLIVSGRSLESILDRRIIVAQTTLSGGLQSAIGRLLSENAITPTDSDRKMSRLVFSESSDPRVLALSVDEQFFGDNLYDVVSDLCAVNGVGFKIIMSSSGEFIFSLYMGEDRSFDQTENPFVSFSPSLDNLSGTSLYYSTKSKKTATLVGGEGDGANKTLLTVMLPGGGGTDLERRELYTDASDIVSVVDGTPLSEEEYATLLTSRGIRDLNDNQEITNFDGKLDPTTTYTYGTDFFVGDIVQMKNEYNLTNKTRITEVVFSENLSGRSVYPTFELVT